MVEQRKWTEEELTLVAALLALGINRSKAAMVAGRVPRSLEKAIAAGRLPIIVADRINTAAAVGSPWQEAEDTVVDILSRMSWEPAQIAELLGRTAASVETRKSRKGIVGPTHSSKDKRDGTWRPCMCCRRIFRSEGIHNRLCYECKAGDGDTRDFYR